MKPSEFKIFISVESYDDVAEKRYTLLYSTSLSSHSPNLTIFSLAPMLMTSLFPVPTPILIRWPRPFLSTHQILMSGQMSVIWSFLHSTPKSTITLFPPQFAQSNAHPRITLNNSILSLERTACILGVTFDPHLKGCKPK